MQYIKEMSECRPYKDNRSDLYKYNAARLYDRPTI